MKKKTMSEYFGLAGIYRLFSKANPFPQGMVDLVYCVSEIALSSADLQMETVCTTLDYLVVTNYLNLTIWIQFLAWRLEKYASVENRTPNLKPSNIPSPQQLDYRNAPLFVVVCWSHL